MYLFLSFEASDRALHPEAGHQLQKLFDDHNVPVTVTGTSDRIFGNGGVARGVVGVAVSQQAAERMLNVLREHGPERLSQSGTQCLISSLEFSPTDYSSVFSQGPGDTPNPPMRPASARIV
jgi:hypothetical protein